MSDGNGQVQLWREGARWGQDLCPTCGDAGSTLAVDFQKFGKHSMRACLKCNLVFADGQRLFNITKPPARSEAALKPGASESGAVPAAPPRDEGFA